MSEAAPCGRSVLGARPGADGNAARSRAGIPCCHWGRTEHPTGLKWGSAPGTGCRGEAELLRATGALWAVISWGLQWIFNSVY